MANREMAKVTYEEQADKIKNRLLVLQKHLFGEGGHGQRFADEGSVSWGLVGDLVITNEKLHDIMASFGLEIYSGG